MKTHTRTGATTEWTRRYARAFSTLEMAVAMAILMAVSLGVTFSLTRTLTQAERAEATQGAERALSIAMENAYSQGYAALSDDSFNRVQACGEDGEENPDGEFSCISVGTTTYLVSYSVTPAADLNDIGSYLTLQGERGVDLTVSTSNTTEEISRTRRVAPPFAGFADDHGALRVHVETPNPDRGSLPELDLYLIDTSGTVVDDITVGDSGSAVFVVPNGSCTPQDPCQVGLQDAAEWWRTGTGVGGGYEWGVAGAAQSQGVVVPNSAGAETTLTVFEGGEIVFNLYAMADNSDVRVPAEHAGSICLWASFTDAGRPTVVPVCNFDHPSRGVIAEFEGPGGSYLIPSETPLVFSVDHPSGTCVTVDGLLGHTQYGWDSRAVCSSWTWGYPTLWSDPGDPTETFDRQLSLQLEPGKTFEYDLIWTGDAARPAAGYPGEGQWLRPREAQGCALDATCLPLGPDKILEDTVCPDAHCFSIANAIPEAQAPNSNPAGESVWFENIDAGTPKVIEVGGVDADGDRLTLRVTHIPAEGELRYDNQTITAGMLPFEVYADQPSGTVAQVVYHTTPGTPGPVYNFEFSVTDANGASDTGRVNLVLGDGVAEVIGNSVVVNQGDTGVAIIATVLDGAGQPRVGEVVTFTPSVEGIVLDETEAVTDDNGQAQVQASIFGAPTGQHTVTLVAGGVQGFAEVTVNSVVGGIYANPGSVTQGGTANITLGATDEGGGPAGGVIITPASVDGLVFTRPSSGLDGEYATVNNHAPRFFASRFFKSIAVAEGTTNHVSNPMLTNTSTISPGWDELLNGTTKADGWSVGLNPDADNPGLGYHAHINPTGGVGGGPAWEFIDENNQYGEAHRTQEASTELSNNPGASFGWEDGTKVTVSFDLRVSELAKFMRVGLRHTGADGVTVTYGDDVADLYATTTGAWQRVQTTFTLDQAQWDYTKPVELVFEGHHADGGIEARAWVDNIMVETSSQHRGFAVGSRADETLSMPGSGVIGATSGTISMLVSPIGAPSPNGHLFSYGGGSGLDGMHITWGSDLGANKVRFLVQDGETSATAEAEATVPGGLQPGRWYWVVARWDLPSGISIDVRDLTAANTYSGSAEAAGVNPDFSEFGTALIGGTGNAGEWANIHIDHFAVARVARDSTHLNSLFNGQLPALADVDTTFLAPFDGTALAPTGLSLGGSCTTTAVGSCEVAVAADAVVPAGVYRLRVTSGTHTGYGALQVGATAGSIDAPSFVILEQNGSVEVTVSVLDGAGAPLVGEIVTFTESSVRFDLNGDTDEDGAVSLETDASGQAWTSVEAAAGAPTGTDTLTVVSGTVSVQVAVEVIAAPSSFTSDQLDIEPGIQGAYQVTVFDDNANPLPGVEVRVSSGLTDLAVGPTNDEDPYVDTAVTDENGVARFTVTTSLNLAPGSYEDALTVVVGSLPAGNADVSVPQRIFDIIFDAEEYTVSQGGEKVISFVAVDNAGNPVDGTAVTPTAAEVTIDMVGDGVTADPAVVSVGADGTATLTISAQNTAPAGSVENSFTSTRTERSTVIQVVAVIGGLEPEADPVGIAVDGYGPVGFILTDLAGGGVAGEVVVITSGDANLQLRPVLLHNPLAWLRLGEGSGSTAADSTTNGNDATYAGTVTRGQAGAIAGDADTAARLRPGTTDGHLVTPFNAADEFSGSFAFSGWVRLNGSPGEDGYLLYAGEDVGEAFYLRVTANSELEVGVGGYSAATGVTLAPDSWHHVVWSVTVDPFGGGFDMVSLFVDGEIQFVEISSEVGTARPDAAVTISTSTHNLDLTVDELAFYNVALPTTAAYSQYQSGVNGSPQVAITKTDGNGVGRTAGAGQGNPGTVTVTGSHAQVDDATLTVNLGQMIGSVAVIPDNPIVNPSFDQGDLYGWVGASEVVFAPVHHGTGAARMAVLPGADLERMYADDDALVVVRPGEMLSLSARVRTDVPGMWVNARVVLLDESKTPLTGGYLVRTTPGADAASYETAAHSADTTVMPLDTWELYKLVATEPVPSGAAYARVEVFTQADGSGNVFADDLRMARMGEPEITVAAGGSTEVHLEVLDAADSPVEGVTVQISEDAPDVSLSASSVVTGPGGRASVTLTAAQAAALGEYTISVEHTETSTSSAATLAVAADRIPGLETVYYELNGAQVNLGQALGVTTTASSEKADSGAGNVLDGVHGPTAGVGDEWRTNGGGTGSWVKVDLGAVKDITEIWLYDRADLSSNFTDGVVEFSTDDQTWTDSIPFNGLPANGAGLRIPTTKAARYIRITAGAGATGTDVGLAEVKVLGGATIANLAATNHATFTASSVFGAVSYGAANAGDGELKTEWRSLGGSGAGTWWAVDLGSDAWVSSLTVYDGADGWFGDFMVKTRQANQGSWTTQFTVTGLPDNGNGAVYTFPEPVQARHLRLETTNATGSNPGLAGVEIWGSFERPQPGAGTVFNSVSQPNLDYAASSTNAFGSGRGSNVAVKATGYINITTGGQYVFYVDAMDDVRLLVDGTEAVSYVMPKGAGWSAPVIGEFNGDAYADQAVVDSGTGDVYVQTGSGTGPNSMKLWLANAVDNTLGDVTLLAGDFDGDGIDDLAWTHESDGDGTLHVALSDGSAFGTKKTWAGRLGAQPVIRFARSGVGAAAAATEARVNGFDVPLDGSFQVEMRVRAEWETPGTRQTLLVREKGTGTQTWGVYLWEDGTLRFGVGDGESPDALLSSGTPVGNFARNGEMVNLRITYALDVAEETQSASFYVDGQLVGSDEAAAQTGGGDPVVPTSVNDFPDEWKNSRVCYEGSLSSNISVSGSTVTEKLTRTNLTACRNGTNWTVPNGVTSVSVQAWGGGGGGHHTTGRGGGGGGYSSRNNISVTPQDTVTIKIGQGGSGGSNPSTSAAPGGDTMFGSVTAGGGGAATSSSAGGAGGTSSGGTTNRTGGSGGTGFGTSANGRGGGGGAGAHPGGNGANGADATSSNPGSGGVGQNNVGVAGGTGSGGNGAAAGANGQPGSIPGGGGGGAGSGPILSSRHGGAGQRGLLILTYDVTEMFVVDVSPAAGALVLGADPYGRAGVLAGEIQELKVFEVEEMGELPWASNSCSDGTLDGSTATEVLTCDHTWTVPTGVTEITVEAWGAGGGGLGTPNDGNTWQGGGGGGAYARSTLSVTPEAGYSVVIGAGGAPGTGNGSPVDPASHGGDTVFGSDLVKAQGGRGGVQNGGNGGSTSDSVGQVRYAGGKGGARAGSQHNGAYNGGGGGAAGSPSGTGAAGSAGVPTGTGAGGVGVNGAGSGGNGGLNVSNGQPGTAPGGGGGGRSANWPNPSATAGAGAKGSMIITYQMPEPESVLVGHWDVRQTAGTTLEDLSTNNNDLVISSGGREDLVLPTRHGTWRWDLTPGTDWARAVSDYSDLDVDRQLGVEFVGQAAWKTNAQLMSLVSKWDYASGSDSAYNLEITAANKLKLDVSTSGGNAASYESTATLDSLAAVEDWDRLHIVAMYDSKGGTGSSSEVRFWVNGEQLGAAITGPSYGGSGRIIYNSPERLTIGGRTGTNPRPFVGYIERVRVSSDIASDWGGLGSSIVGSWNFALDGEDVAATMSSVNQNSLRTATPNTTPTSYTTADIDGDGLVELLVYSPAYREVVSYEHNPSFPDFEHQNTWAANVVGVPPVGTEVVDLHGGRFDNGSNDDLLYVVSADGNYEMWVGLGDGAAVGEASIWASFTQGGVILIGDVGGVGVDGRDDVVVVDPTTGTWTVRLSTGSAFGTPSVWATETPAGTLHTLGDFTGDGRADGSYLTTSPNNRWQWIRSATNLFLGKVTSFDENPASSGTWECTPNATNNTSSEAPTGCFVLNLPAGEHSIEVWAQTSNPTPQGALKVAYSGPDTGDSLTLVPTSALSHQPSKPPLAIAAVDAENEWVLVRNLSATRAVAGDVRLTDRDGNGGVVEINIPAGGQLYIHSGAGATDDFNAYLNGADLWDPSGDTVYLEVDTGGGFEMIHRLVYP